MSNAPLMPMATAVWLVENTTLTFKQIAEFCKLHEVEIQGIADGEVAKGIKAYNPIISGQLSREEIELSSKDESRPLQIKSSDIEISNNQEKIKKYVDKLPEALKTAFTLRESEGKSYEEISTITETPIGTVRSRIFRARENILTYISEDLLDG